MMQVGRPGLSFGAKVLVGGVSREVPKSEIESPKKEESITNPEKIDAALDLFAGILTEPDKYTSRESRRMRSSMEEITGGDYKVTTTEVFKDVTSDGPVDISEEDPIKVTGESYKESVNSRVKIKKVFTNRLVVAGESDEQLPGKLYLHLDPTGTKVKDFSYIA